MTLRGGWYPWEPYQYLKKEGERHELTGLDVQLLREAIEGEIGLELELTQVSWSQHQQELQPAHQRLLPHLPSLHRHPCHQQEPLAC